MLAVNKRSTGPAHRSGVSCSARARPWAPAQAPADCSRPRGESCRSAYREDSAHPRCGVSGNGADEAVLAGPLERHDELRSLARTDQRCSLTVDLEVVPNRADVPKVEHDFSGPADRPRRELE